ncbi:glycerophosphodiester phosphodiesterase family protein [Rhodospirillum sp. A1_3_36]|uniref:glycerophosphodiester phosphodiesterase family protein n=1 Tax=Rhodospirillum sp. A1_3_36 TaxID=3391666 RepID=UPI0039A4A99F
MLSKIPFLPPLVCAALAIGSLAAPAPSHASDDGVTVGPRPYYLMDQLDDGPLKDKLMSCAGKPVHRTLFSIGHRGAPLQFPEHTLESYRAAYRMGAGIIECDVAFTKDKQLVCRHAQNDLHTTTNILATPLAEKCTQPFVPAQGDTPAQAECRTSDLTLEEFLSLKGKMDAADKTATTVEAYMNATPHWRTDLYATGTGTLMTHAQYIALVHGLGAKFTPELKAPAVDMPFDGLTQDAYAQMMIDEYKAAGIPPEDVWAQSFNLDDILYWIKNEPAFGKQAVFLDEGTEDEAWDNMNPDTWAHSMADLKAQGVTYIAPALWMLVTAKDGKIIPSRYAEEAKAAGLKIITWSLERSGPLVTGGGWYYKSINDITTSDAKMYELVDVLAKDVGVVGMFSDWPATVSYYASCMGLE